MNIVLVTITVVGFFTTMFLFLKFFASFLSLTSATDELAREKPLRYLMTGGFDSLWLVLKDHRNAVARTALARNGLLFLASLAVTMGAALLLITLNPNP